MKMWVGAFSLGLLAQSSWKLDIFMALHVTRIWDKLEAIWLFQVQVIDPPSPSHEITR